MPKATAYALIWSAERAQYEWHHQREQASSSVPLDAAADLHRLVAGSSSFAFQGQCGHMTLRKETRPHGEGYWYAYRSQGRRTHKKYLGRANDLTVAHLESIAAMLAAEPHISTGEHFPRGTIPTSHTGSSNTNQEALQTGHHLPVLAPKLQLPRLPASLVTRERLLRQLDSGSQGKLTLLSAPAGFGKTTAVSQWLTQQRTLQPHLSVAWLSLDPGDNDPDRFWRYVLLACQPLLTEHDQSALLGLLRSRPALAASHLEPLLRTFLNALAFLPYRGMLILEDYHVITEPEIHEALTFVLEHLPAMFHLVIITRVDPPLPLARLRAHGDLCELRGEELRFSEEETACFLQQSLPEILSSEQIHALDRRLEGWVTGLRLVVLALQRRLSQSEVEQYLATFSGSQHHLFSFFISEVLAAQPEPLQRFLLQTSILDRFCVSLCDAVMAGQGSERMLRAVEEANLFLYTLDGSGQWYRYHPLFAEAMQYEARQRLGAEAVCTWYGRASQWYELAGQPSEAVEMALCAEDFSRAATLIEKSLRPHHTYKEMKEYHTLRRWLNTLPEDVLVRHPRLCARSALLLTFSEGGYSDDRLAQADYWLGRAESMQQTESNLSVLGEIRTIRAFLLWKRGDVVHAAHRAGEALVLLPEGESQWRGACLRIIGEEKMLSGHVREASQHFLETLTLFEVDGNRAGAQAVRLVLAEAYQLQGALHQAAELYRAVEAATEDLAKAGRAQLGLAQLSYGWNDLEHAAQEAQQALAVGMQLDDVALQARASLVLADIELARGQATVAQQRLHALFARLSGVVMHFPLLHRQLLARQTRLALTVGDFAAVERWLSASAEREVLPLLYQEQEACVSLRLLLVRGEAEVVIRRLRRWQALAHQQGRLRSELELLLLRALAFFATGDRPRAFFLLSQALSLARIEGEQRLFLDEGEKMAVLLRTALPVISNGPSAIYGQTLLNAFAPPNLQPSSAVISSPLLEQLSPQERRVLGLMMAGCSNPEIAQTLVVSINTVKTQVRSIYQKLHVKNRKQMREIARSYTLP